MAIDVNKLREKTRINGMCVRATKAMMDVMFTECDTVEEQHQFLKEMQKFINNLVEKTVE